MCFPRHGQHQAVLKTIKTMEHVPNLRKSSICSIAGGPTKKSPLSGNSFAFFLLFLPFHSQHRKTMAEAARHIALLNNIIDQLAREAQGLIGIFQRVAQHRSPEDLQALSSQWLTIRLLTASLNQSLEAGSHRTTSDNDLQMYIDQLGEVVMKMVDGVGDMKTHEYNFPFCILKLLSAVKNVVKVHIEGLTGTSAPLASPSSTEQRPAQHDRDPKSDPSSAAKPVLERLTTNVLPSIGKTPDLRPRSPTTSETRSFKTQSPVGENPTTNVYGDRGGSLGRPNVVVQGAGMIPSRYGSTTSVSGEHGDTLETSSQDRTKHSIDDVASLEKALSAVGAQLDQDDNQPPPIPPLFTKPTRSQSVSALNTTEEEVVKSRENVDHKAVLKERDKVEELEAVAIPDKFEETSSIDVTVEIPTVVPGSTELNLDPQGDSQLDKPSTEESDVSISLPTQTEAPKVNPEMITQQDTTDKVEPTETPAATETAETAKTEDRDAVEGQHTQAQVPIPTQGETLNTHVQVPAITPTISNAETAKASHSPEPSRNKEATPAKSTASRNSTCLPDTLPAIDTSATADRLAAVRAKKQLNRSSLLYVPSVRQAAAFFENKIHKEAESANSLRIRSASGRSSVRIPKQGLSVDRFASNEGSMEDLFAGASPRPVSPVPDEKQSGIKDKEAEAVEARTAEMRTEAVEEQESPKTAVPDEEVVKGDKRVHDTSLDKGVRQESTHFPIKGRLNEESVQSPSANTPSTAVQEDPVPRLSDEASRQRTKDRLSKLLDIAKDLLAEDALDNLVSNDIGHLPMTIMRMETDHVSPPPLSAVKASVDVKPTKEGPGDSPIMRDPRLLQFTKAQSFASSTATLGNSSFSTEDLVPSHASTSDTGSVLVPADTASSEKQTLSGEFAFDAYSDETAHDAQQKEDETARQSIRPVEPTTSDPLPVLTTSSSFPELTMPGTTKFYGSAADLLANDDTRVKSFIRDFTSEENATSSTSLSREHAVSEEPVWKPHGSAMDSSETGEITEDLVKQVEMGEQEAEAIEQAESKAEEEKDAKRQSQAFPVDLTGGAEGEERGFALRGGRAMTDVQQLRQSLAARLVQTLQYQPPEPTRPLSAHITNVSTQAEAPTSQALTIMLMPLNGQFPLHTIELVQPYRLGRGNPREGFKSFSSQVVSRNHCDIFAQDDKVYIQDCGSNSGTFLNGVRMSDAGTKSEPVEVRSGDFVQLGKDYEGAAVGNLPEARRRCVKMQIVILNRDHQQSSPSQQLQEQTIDQTQREQQDAMQPQLTHFQITVPLPKTTSEKTPTTLISLKHGTAVKGYP
ncbi:hypothetical protein, variant [Spizellomyces punctatus DAOM BR117]|uniref:FHA domain-containing protein n=1 Tax=Spizellomyces punctatus (strain DAOM BR117) TaxID=645134 RepID=A0A0L0H7W1_SPIPD|nr:hypothetical protein, variant [Spizellomyces punctatus DAOM BR117]KNC97595.1 hypothetical protein, variant [Spizellomyces punctatus DAOM BR117]|eukprot:XP_016605635.1 hypothetical protein, variant [Spizellomyces punctatus DAOM BR117]